MGIWGVDCGLWSGVSGDGGWPDREVIQTELTACCLDPRRGLAGSSTRRDKFSVARLILLVMLMIGWDMLMSLMIGDNDVIMKTHTRWWLTTNPYLPTAAWWWEERERESYIAVYWIIKTKLISAIWPGLATNTVNTWLAPHTSHCTALHAGDERLWSRNISQVLTAVMVDIQGKYRWYPDHLKTLFPSQL